MGRFIHTNIFAQLIAVFFVVSTMQVHASMHTASAAASKANEDQVRAAVVVGIVRYTIWNEDVGDALNFCLVGESPSFPFIRALNNQKRFLGIPLKIIDIKGDDQAALSSCEVVVLGTTENSSPKLDNVSSCLTICDRCNKSEEDSAVVIQKVDNRIRFNVSLKKAKALGIAFKSAMLELAAKVEGVDD